MTTNSAVLPNYDDKESEVEEEDDDIIESEEEPPEDQDSNEEGGIDGTCELEEDLEETAGNLKQDLLEKKQISNKGSSTLMTVGMVKMLGQNKRVKVGDELPQFDSP